MQMPVTYHKGFHLINIQELIFMPVTYISNTHHMSSLRMLLLETSQLILQSWTLHTVWSLIMWPVSVHHNTGAQFRLGFLNLNSFVLDITVKPLFYTSTGTTSNWIQNWKKHTDWETTIMQIILSVTFPSLSHQGYWHFWRTCHLP